MALTDVNSNRTSNISPISISGKHGTTIIIRCDVNDVVKRKSRLR